MTFQHKRLACYQPFFPRPSAAPDENRSSKLYIPFQFSRIIQTLDKEGDRFAHELAAMRQHLDTRNMLITMVMNEPPIKNLHRALNQFSEIIERSTSVEKTKWKSELALLEEEYHNFQIPQYLIQNRSDMIPRIAALFEKVVALADRFENIIPLDNGSKQKFEKIRLIAGQPFSRPRSFGTIRGLRLSLGVQRATNWQVEIKKDIMVLLRELQRAQERLNCAAGRTDDYYQLVTRGAAHVSRLRQNVPLDAEAEAKITQFENLHTLIENRYSKTVFQSFRHRIRLHIQNFFKALTLKRTVFGLTFFLGRSLLAPIQGTRNLIKWGIDLWHILKNPVPELKFKTDTISENQIRSLKYIKHLNTIGKSMKAFGGSVWEMTFLPGLFFPPLFLVSNMAGALFLIGTLCTTVCETMEFRKYRTITQQLFDGITRDADVLQQQVQTPGATPDTDSLHVQVKELFSRLGNYGLASREQIQHGGSAAINAVEFINWAITINVLGILAAHGTESARDFFQFLPSRVFDQMHVMKLAQGYLTVREPVSVMAALIKEAGLTYSLFNVQADVLDLSQKANLSQVVNRELNYRKLQIAAWTMLALERQKTSPGRPTINIEGRSRQTSKSPALLLLQFFRSIRPPELQMRGIKDVLQQSG